MAEPELIPRDVMLVACAISQNLPPEKTEFKNDISTFIKNDLAYRSPEMRIHHSVWLIFESCIMKKHIPIPVEPWEHKIVDIFIGKTPLDEVLNKV
jgi:hypothetical protein